MVLVMVWLIYMLFPLAAVGEQSPAEQWIGFPLLIVFIACYVIGFLRTQWRLAAIIVHLVIIGYFIWRYHESFIYMAFYTVSLLGLLPSVREIAIGLSGLFALFGLDLWRYETTGTMDDFLQLLPAILALLLLPVAMLVSRRSQRLRTQLQLANDEIARLFKSEERQRISRELHDTLGHTLTMITLKSELAEKLIDSKPERAKQEIYDVQMTSRAALKQVRELVSDMSAVTIQDELANAKRILSTASIGLKLQGDFASIAINPLLDNLLGMCLREAVTNAVKHSRARTCTIDWAEEPGLHRLTVSDDGVGIAGNGGGPNVTPPGHNGLRGMQERLNLVDGKLNIDSPNGRGTRMTITVPKVNTTSREETRA
ncbi:sensor histidine kinase [Cohnella yongneupensis]|uniref:histidine kinase n=1 Tax=Cohnella yongneupensis TaxID=425006 RepID=A0ABW0R3D0_9BACL